MFKGALAGVDGLGGTNAVRHVTDEVDVLAAGLACDGEVSLARDAGLDFDEVGSAVMEHVDGGAAALRRGDGDGGVIGGVRSVEHGSGDDHARAEEPVRLDIVAGFEDRVESAAHVADAGDAEGGEERKCEVAAVARGFAEEDVRVHVPEAGHEEAAVRVDDGALCGIVGCGIVRSGIVCLSIVCFSGMLFDGNDAVLLDPDGGFGVELTVADVDHGAVRDRDRLRRRTRWEEARREEQTEAGETKGRAHQPMLLAAGEMWLSLLL